MKKIPFSDHVKLHQTLSISPNSKGTVWSFTIPNSTIGFIKKVRTNWFEDTKWEWRIDGESIESGVEREIDEDFDPPYVVQNNIKFIAENNSSNTLTFEVIVNGVLIMRR
jgi:hypothetical protein